MQAISNRAYISRADREVLRPLAAQVREIAEHPRNAAAARRMAAHNSLKTDGPLVLVFPEGSWDELLPAGQLLCEDEDLRGVEQQLRMRLFQQTQIRDDSAELPWLFISPEIAEGGYGVASPKTQGDHRGSYVWDHPIKSLDTALDQLVFRSLHHDQAASDARWEKANEAVGDILAPKWECRPWWTMGMTWKIIDLIGMEALMLGMIDQPEDIHSLMAWMRDEHNHYLDWMEASGLLTPTHEGAYCGSGGFGWCDELHPPSDGPAPLIESWGFAESQETVGISPAMFAEFILPYQASLMERFGLSYYGCCEPVDQRWAHIKTLPRLRRVSISPWCNEEVMAQELGKDYVYCRKPNPAPFCIDFDEAALAASLDHTLSVARGCIVEIIMKDTHTCQHDPSRFGRWVELARRRIDAVWR